MGRAVSAVGIGLTNGLEVFSNEGFDFLLDLSLAFFFILGLRVFEKVGLEVFFILGL